MNKTRGLSGKLNPAYRHGMAGTPTYKLWAGILSRCYNPKVKIYKYYGGRGITVCERWHKFENFYADMGERPGNLQIDRINNDLGYSPDNCKWVTAKENNPYLKGTVKDQMIGKTFGRITVLERVSHKPNHRYYMTKCACGSTAIRCGSDLRKGLKECKSCKNVSHREWHKRRKNALNEVRN